MRFDRLFCLALAPLILAAGCGGSPRQTPGAEEANATPAADEQQQECGPALESRSPNARNQEPAFEGQTRACSVRSDVALEVTVVAGGLSHPWAVEPLPGGDLLVTERPGRMRIVSAQGTVGQPIAGLPDIEAGGQGGLLDVALSPNFG
ncbi:MAG TPA: PQQ-dependent sugar dehydrogenase, partial [Longimicrobiales bacterium]